MDLDSVLDQLDEFDAAYDADETLAADYAARQAALPDPGFQAHVRATIVHQIGRMNLLAISGGRARPHDPLGVSLPVGHGYSVTVDLDEASDTYTVTRVFTRAGKVFEKGSVSGVYCDQVGEIAYQASCYHHDFPKGWN